jgi:hypothetical protein
VKYYKIKLQLSFLFTFFLVISGQSQEYLQIEMVNTPESIKIPLGYKFTVKTKSLNEWHTIRSNRFLYKDSTIVYDDGFLHLRDITDIQRTRPPVRALGLSLKTFGGGWLLFGGISGELYKNKQLNTRDLSVGLGSFAAGWLVEKLFYKHTLKIGKRYRVRLLDLRVY